MTRAAAAGVLIAAAGAGLLGAFASDPVVSNELAFPDGEGRSRVVRTERWNFEPGEGPLEAEWLLEERGRRGGTRRTRISRNDGDPKDELRRVRYELSWREPGRILDARSREGGTVSVLFLEHERVVLRNWTPDGTGGLAAPLSAEIRRRLAGLPVPLPERELRVEGEFFGARSRDLHSADPDTVLVLGPRFGTHGSTVARGPVVLLGEAHLMGPVVSESWILLADRAFPRDAVVAPAIHVRGEPILSQAGIRPAARRRRARRSAPRARRGARGSSRRDRPPRERGGA